MKNQNIATWFRYLRLKQANNEMLGTYSCMVVDDVLLN